MSRAKRQPAPRGQQQGQPFTPETRQAILAAMTRKALQGNTAAAKIVLDEYGESNDALARLDTLLAEFREAVAQMPSTDTTTTPPQ